MPSSWISTAEAARRLGVKPATLYAYVSRGVLTRRRGADGRSSVFDAAELAEIATHRRSRRPRLPAELAIESGITAMIDDRPYYRGRDVIELAREHSFEEVAGFLWSGEMSEQPLWYAAQEGVAAARAALAGLPAQTLPLEKLQVTVAALAAADPLRLRLDPLAVGSAGRNLIVGMTEALSPSVGEHSQTVPALLWRALSPHRPSPGQLAALRATLVLLADHELAASTLAARVAASVRADPYAVVAAGLGVVGGALHGGATLGAEAMLADAREPGDVPHVVGERLRRGERIPGFGHFVYRDGDPRATVLLDLLRQEDPGSEWLAIADALLAEVRQHRLPEPNVDFAVAVLARMGGMVKGAGEAVFAVARTAGWIAHAIEEYAHGSPLRPRAIYTGPPPSSG